MIDRPVRSCGPCRASSARQLTLAVQQLASIDMLRRYPDATDEEIWLRLAAERLGRDVVLKVYGFDAESK